MGIFILFVWTLVSFICVSVDAQGDPDHKSDPFLISIDVNSPRFWELPSTTIPSLTDKNADDVMIAACPAESSVFDILKAVSKKAVYCLFEKIFNNNEKKSCGEEVLPMLHSVYDEFEHEKITCGPNKKDFLYEFGFYFCGSRDIIEQLRNKKKKENPEKYIKPIFFPIYQLCVDTSKHKALWTKYNMMTPAMFLEKDNKSKLRSESEGDPKEIGTFDLAWNPEKYFTKVIGYYAAQKEGTPDKPKPKMKPAFMVPMEHVAIRMWRKAVNHIVNTAPLLDQKDKLMTAINDGIKKIAFNLYKEHRRLSVYTAVRKVNKKKVKGVWTDVRNANIWYKLLYEEKNKLAAMVVLHNDPAGAPKENKDKACSDLMDCDTMENWYVNQYLGDPNVPPTDLEFAYCCNPKLTEIENIFHMHLEMKGALDIDKNFEKNYQDGSTSQPSGLPNEEMESSVYDAEIRDESGHERR